MIGKKQNIVSGFKTCGLWPPSLKAMTKRWTRFNGGGIEGEMQDEVVTWIRVREEVRAKVLLPPAKPSNERLRRKTIDVNNWLSMHDQLS